MIFQVIKQRLSTSLLSPPPSDAALRRAAQLAENLREDGTWADVAEADPGAEDARRPHEHLQRTLLLAQANHRRGGELDEPLRRALDFWLAYDFESPDWRQNQLLVPRAVGSVALLFEAGLSAGARGKVMEIMARSRWQYWAAPAGWTDWTGNTLLQLAHNILLRGCLNDTPAVFEESFSRVFGTIRIAADGEEGIQPDMVYRPSQTQPPESDEGLSFATECARFIVLAHGTPWQASAEVMNLLATFLLNGQQWFMRNGVIDAHLGTRGSDPRPGDREELAAAVEQLAGFADTPRRMELAAFAQRLAGRGNTLTGHRHFWRSGFSVHQRPAYYASVRLAPAYVAADGNPLSWHAPQAPSPEGMTCVMRTGHEYDGIRNLPTDAGPPGTTFKEDRTAAAGWTLTGGVTFLGGGVSEGDFGAAAIQCDRGGVGSAKAWFYFDQSFVCLGAGIASPDADGTVFTSANDCRLNGPVYAEWNAGASRVLEPGRSHELPGAKRISHDGLTYHFLKPSKVVARLGAAAEAENETKPDGAERFTLWLDHGTQPQEENYAYMVLPLGGDGDAKAKVDEEVAQVDLLANTPLLQAVRHRGLGLTGIIFWQAGLVALPDGGRVAANQPCVLLCRDTPSAGKRLSIANLRKQATTVHVEYAGRSHAFELPGGLDAGRGINRSL